MSFIAIVPLVAVAERVGLSPFCMAALSASCLCPVADRFRHAQTPCPFHVTIQALSSVGVVPWPWLPGLAAFNVSKRTNSLIAMNSTTLHTFC